MIIAENTLYHIDFILLQFVAGLSKFISFDLINDVFICLEIRWNDVRNESLFIEWSITARIF